MHGYNDIIEGHISHIGTTKDPFPHSVLARFERS